MQVPPIQFDLSTEKADPPLPRMPWVWFLSIFLFGFLIVGSLSIHDKKSPIRESASKTKEKTLELQLCMKSMKANRNMHMFEQQTDDLLKDAKKSVSAQKMRIVLRREDNLDPFKDDLRNLAKSSKPEDQEIGRAHV